MSAVVFPIYLLAKDCGDVERYSSPEELQQQLEAIDVENDEYDAWDSTGGVVKLSVDPLSRKQWLKVKNTGVRITETEFAVLRAKATRTSEPKAKG
jgi:hypothetical protein